MTARLRDPKVLAGVVAGGVILVAAIVWFGLVSPQRSKADKLDGQIASVQTQIDQRKAALATPKANVKIKASDLYRLNRAMPADTDMSGIIMALNRLAAGHSLAFNSLQPGAPVVQSGFNVQPLTVSVQGRFSHVSGFLGDLRKLVTVKKRQLAVTGRLFSVDSVEFGAPDSKTTFPNVKATLVVDAFMFAGGVQATAPDQSTSTTTEPSGTVAAGANP